MTRRAVRKWDRNGKALPDLVGSTSTAIMGVCGSPTKGGNRCRNSVLPGERCHLHSWEAQVEDDAEDRVNPRGREHQADDDDADDDEWVSL